MKTNTQILPGVSRIGWVDCRHLPRRVDLHGICQTIVPVMTAVEEVPFFGEASCECRTEKESGNRHDTASLKFRCAKFLPLHLHLGFVVTDKTSRSWLIGSAEPPYPTIKVTRKFGDVEQEAAGYEYEITHNALKSLVECAASF